LPALPNLIFASRSLQLSLRQGLILARAAHVSTFRVALTHLIEAVVGEH